MELLIFLSVLVVWSLNAGTDNSTAFLGFVYIKDPIEEEKCVIDPQLIYIPRDLRSVPAMLLGMLQKASYEICDMNY